jgi:hypothetical protein
MDSIQRGLANCRDGFDGGQNDLNRFQQVARQDRNLQPYHALFYVVNAGLRKTLVRQRTVTKDTADRPIGIGATHILALDFMHGYDELALHLPAMRGHRREMHMQQILLLVQWL